MIIRPTAPNWERPSPYDGSHIIMYISDIYQSCINSHIITFLSRILIPFAQYIIFPVHITSPQYTCAVFDSSALTDGCLRTFSLYSPSHVRSCIPCLRTGPCPTCPTSLSGGQVWTSVRRSINLTSKYRSAPDYSGTSLHK